MPATLPPERQEFDAIVQDLQARPEVSRALLASSDGLLLAGAPAGGDDGEMWGAVSAVLARLGDQLTVSEEGGALQAAVFYAEGCRLVVHRVALGFVLAVADPEADLDQLCAEVACTAQKVEAHSERLVGGRPRGN